MVYCLLSDGLNDDFKVDFVALFGRGCELAWCSGVGFAEGLAAKERM